ncbi:response regulator transcription factor [Streptomyces sp. NBC_00083]|uniref:helix-turn-helix transcriptional regulator n=1 Tax=Streptomyces sp. NBC_00083 TaxID=2975647 RepID=UPI002254CFD4|nr:response regulator transcription factor [Streptomyces sp. NBC_00083]MCX5388045.1 response regulator transcription factor [Streptomyces sp. NBC_00083]
MSLPTARPARGLTVALAVRQDIHRYGLEGMLHSLEEIASIFSHPAIADAVEAAPGTLPDLLLTSTAELDETTDPSVARYLRDHGVRLVVLIGPDERMTSAWASQVHGFVDRSALHLSLLRDAVVDVSAGRFHVSASLARRLLVPADPGPAVALTAREVQVLELVAGGLSNKQAARSLGISENGVKRLMGNILAKLNSPNRTLAVVRALEIGLLAKPAAVGPAHV